MMELAKVDWNVILSPPSLPIILAFTLGAVVTLTLIVTTQWRRVRVAEAEAALKLRMVERGFSATEIERVVAAGIDSERPNHRPARAEPKSSFI